MSGGGGFGGGGSGGTASPIDVIVGSPTGSNDQTLINAAITKAKTAGKPARLVFSPGTYVCSTVLTSMAQTSMIQLVGGGGRHPRTFPLGARTEIRYTGTGAGTFIDATDATGFGISGLDVTYSSTSFTGKLIDAGGAASAPSYSPKFQDSFLGSTLSTTKTATILNLGKVVEASLEDVIISGGAVGIDGSGSYANAITMSGGRFDYCTIAVKNPQFQWVFTGTVFEPGCVIKSVGVNAEGLTFNGCGWWDNVTPGWAWIDVQGSGIAINGGYWEPQAGSAETLVKLNGAFDGLSITGLKAHGMNGSVDSPVLTLAAGASLANYNYAGCSLTNCVDGLAAALAIGTVSFAPARPTNDLRAMGNSGATLAVPYARSVSATLTANCSISLPTVAPNYEHTIRLALTQDATGSRTVSWSASVVWPGAVAPTITPTANKTDVFEFSTMDGGTTWRGEVVGQNYSTVVTLPTAVAVYDAQQLVLSDGAAVATWSDTGGSARDATMTVVGNRPTYIASAINAKAAVRFNGTKYLYTPSTYANSAVFPSGTFTVIAVAKTTLSSGFASIGGMDPNQGSARNWQLRINWNAGSPLTEALAFANNGTGNVTDTQATDTATAHVYVMSRDTSTVQAWVDGTSNGSSAIGTVQRTGSTAIAVGSGGTQISASNAIANGFVGDIAYLAIYPGVLSTGQRQAEEARLKALYGTP